MSLPQQMMSAAASFTACSCREHHCGPGSSKPLITSISARQGKTAPLCRRIATYSS